MAKAQRTSAVESVRIHPAVMEEVRRLAGSDLRRVRIQSVVDGVAVSVLITNNVQSGRTRRTASAG